ncbi:MAG: hypothetical protein OEZ57_05580 [Nitrospirota bacterium]|nr:hypothetical protein [Nitrospirota bacterium]MDH5586522.1 hypothetical protein [Nitrospirota bacterium]MDH5774370.1 hypothetical protein [Nitrospirota bacterium]
MAEQHKQYAEGKSGELYGYTGTAPEGTIPLVKDDGATLTPAGLKYCQRRGYPSPMVATLRVLHDQYQAPAVGYAIEASALNAEMMLEKQNNTKAMSERLRLDWEQQDKAFKANVAAAAKAEASAATEGKKLTEAKP